MMKNSILDAKEDDIKDANKKIILQVSRNSIFQLCHSKDFSSVPQFWYHQKLKAEVIFD